MLHLKFIIRSLLRNKRNLFIHIGGLAVAFTFILLLSSLGVFALAHYYCQGKQKEIAIRKVNGATDYQIWSLITRYFLRLVLISFIVACLFAGFYGGMAQQFCL